MNFLTVFARHGLRELSFWEMNYMVIIGILAMALMVTLIIGILSVISEVSARRNGGKWK